MDEPKDGKKTEPEDAKVKPRIIVTLNDNLTITVEMSVANRMMAFGMLEETKEIIIEEFLKRRIKKEQERQKLAGGTGMIAGLKEMFDKKKRVH